MEDAWVPGHEPGFNFLNVMNASQGLPVFDDCFPELNQFILNLVQAYEDGSLNSWQDMEGRVNANFTPQRMEQMESMVPGWQKMASYSGGITLVHLMFVFLSLYILPEFQGLTPEQKQLAKWIVLFHDIDKFHIAGKKDTMHAFRSAVNAARTLPNFGFRTAVSYPERIDSWGKYTTQAFIAEEGNAVPKPDNHKLPEILAGIEQLYANDTPAVLIIKTILFHISFHEDDEYPTPAPLTEDEIKRYMTSSLLPFSRIMMLSDNLAWTLFEPEYRDKRRKAALAFFQNVENLIAAKQDRS